MKKRQGVVSLGLCLMVGFGASLPSHAIESSFTLPDNADQLIGQMAELLGAPAVDARARQAAIEQFQAQGLSLSQSPVSLSGRWLVSGQSANSTLLVEFLNDGRVVWLPASGKRQGLLSGFGQENSIAHYRLRRDQDRFWLDFEHFVFSDQALSSFATQRGLPESSMPLLSRALQTLQASGELNADQAAPRFQLTVVARSLAGEANDVLNFTKVSQATTEPPSAASSSKQLAKP